MASTGAWLTALFLGHIVPALPLRRVDLELLLDRRGVQQFSQPLVSSSPRAAWLFFHTWCKAHRSSRLCTVSFVLVIQASVALQTPSSSAIMPAFTKLCSHPLSFADVARHSCRVASYLKFVLYPLPKRLKRHPSFLEMRLSSCVVCSVVHLASAAARPVVAQLTPCALLGASWRAGHPSWPCLGPQSCHEQSSTSYDGRGCVDRSTFARVCGRSKKPRESACNSG